MKKVAPSSSPFFPPLIIKQERSAQSLGSHPPSLACWEFPQGEALCNPFTQRGISDWVKQYPFKYCPTLDQVKGTNEGFSSSGDVTHEELWAFQIWIYPDVLRL